MQLAAMFKKLLALSLLTLLSLQAQADLDILEPDHPESYTVKKGDTLWDIADRFLKNPWQWPEIWQANPQIENPHLIYPGDLISLSYENGQARLTVTRNERPTVKMSPHARVLSVQDAIPTIPLKAIEPFMSKFFVYNEPLSDAPYIISFEDGELRGFKTQKAYAMDLEKDETKHYSIIRPVSVYYEAPNGDVVVKSFDSNRHKTLGDKIRPYLEQLPWEKLPLVEKGPGSTVLGYEYLQVATAQFIAEGQPATLLITENDKEVRMGDLVVPLLKPKYPPVFHPKAVTTAPEGFKVAAATEAVRTVGKYRVISTNKGLKDGVEPGQVYASFNQGGMVRDDVKYAGNDIRTIIDKDKAMVKLPNEYSGHFMIFKSFDHISYGLVLRGKRPVKAGAAVLAP